MGAASNTRRSRRVDHPIHEAAFEQLASRADHHPAEPVRASSGRAERLQEPLDVRAPSCTWTNRCRPFEPGDCLPGVRPGDPGSWSIGRTDTAGCLTVPARTDISAGQERRRAASSVSLD